MNDLVILIARILLVALFLVTGFGFAMGSEGIAGYFGSLGIPAPGIVVWLVVLLKVVGGLAILVGFQTRNVAYLFAAFCILAPLIGHTNWADQNEMITFLKDFGLAGGFLLLTITGAGAYSVDARRG